MMPVLAALALLLVPASSSAQEEAPRYRAQKAAPSGGGVDFCSPGKFLLFTGDCSLPEGAPNKDSISIKACADVNSVLSAGLRDLYPNARVYKYKDLSPDELHETLAKSSVLGFFFIGRGDVNGGLVTGGAGDVSYPERQSCVALYDVFGGFTSHSKYSPDVAAPKKMRGKVLARTEVLYKGEGAPEGSWPKVCYPKVSLVYPTRTFAGRMKKDAMKLIGTLQEEKKRQVLEVLTDICGSCAAYAGSGSPLEELCPPRSDLCGGANMTPADAKKLLKNYCYAIHPELIPSRPE
ncbi:MAG TPA: hypothetical protein PL037_06495 [Elusimicrobiales bacterium]|nr:hypothetical protein [Elusimicrobiales bacterium]